MRYLIKEVNKNEIEIRSIIEKTKTRELSIPDAKEEFVKIKSKARWDNNKTDENNDKMKIIIIPESALLNLHQHTPKFFQHGH